MYRAINVMEILVQEILEDLLKVHELEVCKCDKCKADIIALTLNKLPPKYITSEKGEKISKKELSVGQYKVDIFKYLIKSIDKIKTNPIHNDYEIEQDEEFDDNYISYNVKAVHEKIKNKQEDYMKEKLDKLIDDENVNEILDEIDSFLNKKN